jgi:F-type H+-transporting ATPase subunit gamma
VTRLAEIQAHIGSMGELRDIIGAMRSLAGMRAQEAQHALPGVSRYAEAMAAAIGGALLLFPQAPPERATDHGRLAFILCMAEQGFVGGFNERLLDAAEAALAPRDALFVLGARGAALAVERERHLTWMSPMATRSAGAPEIIRRLSAELYARIARGEISRVEAMFARCRQGGAPTIERTLLLPLDLEKLQARQPRQAPLHNLEPQALLERLMPEYVFALLTEAAVESIASENAARFAAMESALDNEREARQSEITTELLDLITGAEAQRGE